MYLLDTNVVSELRKIRAGKPDPNVLAWSRGVALNQMHLSVITVEELEIGCLLAAPRDPVKSRAIRTWLDTQILPSFEGRIISVDLAIAQASARLHVPNTRPIRDSFLAATALVHGLTVVTRNIVDFQTAGVSLLNPWLPTSSNKIP